MFLQPAEEEMASREKVLVPLAKCQGCSTDFSDDRKPRNLACGHVLCTLCTETLLDDEKPCLECGEKQRKGKVDEPPVNYQLLRFSRYLMKKTITIKITTFSADISKFNHEEELWKCNVHDNPKVLFCRSCNLWICVTCLVVDHPELPRGTCRVLRLANAIDQIRKQYEKVAANIQNDVETMKQDFELDLGMHDFCLQHCTEERSHLRLVKELEPLLLGKREENNEEVKKAKGRLKKMTESFRATNSPEEITAACKELVDFQEELKAVIKQEKERLTKAWPSMLKHFRMEIKRLAEGGLPLYATFQEDKIHRWSRLSLIKGRLLLYALNEGTPPSDGMIVPYKYMETLVDDVWRTVFIEVNAGEEVPLGRVFIKLSDNNALTQQMFLMCSGQKGVSFRNSKLFHWQEGRLSGGDYQRSDGSKGGTIVQGLGECLTSSLYCGEKNRGAVLGERHSTRFHILLNNPNEFICDALGIITEGFQVIKAAAKTELVTEPFIKDCGIFISINRIISESSEEEEDDDTTSEE